MICCVCVCVCVCVCCAVHKTNVKQTNQKQKSTAPGVPGGLPSKYYPGPTLLNFGDLTRTGAFNVVWPLTSTVQDQWGLITGWGFTGLLVKCPGFGQNYVYFPMPMQNTRSQKDFQLIKTHGWATWKL